MSNEPERSAGPVQSEIMRHVGLLSKEETQDIGAKEKARKDNQSREDGRVATALAAARQTERT